MADLFIGVNGIVLDERGWVLLIRRDDILTWSLPGGGLEAGELPTDGAVREVEEETGLEVIATSLSGLYYRTFIDAPQLILVFKCEPVGGELTTTAESLQVDFKPVDSFPRTLFLLHRERIQHALTNDGDRPYWGRQLTPRWEPIAWRTIVRLIYSWKNWRRKHNNQPAYNPPSPWRTGAFTVIRNISGQVLWVKRTDYDVWNLPGGKSEAGEAPWETAIRETKEETGLDAELTGLSGVYIKPAINEMIFCFTADVTSGHLTLGIEAAGFAYFAVGGEPANTLPKQLTRAADSVKQSSTTRFRIQAGPPGLDLLKLR